MERFEMEALTAGRHNVFLPMTFLNETEGTTIYYEYGDCRNIYEEEWEHPYILMEILEKIILKIGEGEKNLLFQEGYLLNKENIYLDDKDKEIFIKYVPVSVENRASAFKHEPREFRFTLLDFIENLEIRNSVTAEYLEILCKELKKGKMSRKTISNRIFDLKREIYQCGWVISDRA